MRLDRLCLTVFATLFEWLGQSERARALHEAIFQSYPDDVSSVRTIAWLLGRMERWPEAVAWLETAVELDGRHADTWFNLGYARERAGRHAETLVAFRRATELDPGHDLAWFGLGMAKVRLRDDAGAALALSQATKLKPLNGDAWYALGMVWHRCHEPDRVRRVIEHCAVTAPPVAWRLIRETARADLLHLVAHLRDRR